ncbi:hypothetical protein Tco_0353021 [Tanacetum coccineum]
MLNPSPDVGIDSLFNLNTESTLLVDVPVTTFAEPPLLSATTLPPPPTPLITHLQQTPVPTSPTVLSSSLQDLPNFGSLFGFDHRLKSLENNFLEFNQTNQFAAAVSSILGIVDAYLANKMHEAVKTVVHLQSKRLRDEAQAENADFLNKLDDNIKKIIKDQVKEQVKAQVSKILPKIKKTVNEQLEAEVLTRSSNESKTSHAVAANLSELELKKILIDKMESNKSIHRSDEQKNLYKALVDAYESDKLILDTYGDTVSFKRRRDDEDKDEEPSTIKTGIAEWHGYKHLDWITIHRDDDKLYTFKEGDFKRLRVQDIDDLLILLVQGKLTNLNVEDHLAFSVSLRMFTRNNMETKWQGTSSSYDSAFGQTAQVEEDNEEFRKIYWCENRLVKAGVVVDCVQFHWFHCESFEEKRVEFHRNVESEGGLSKTKKGTDEEKKSVVQDSTYSIALIKRRCHGRERESADKVKDRKEKHDSDDDEDDVERSTFSGSQTGSRAQRGGEYSATLGQLKTLQKEVVFDFEMHRLIPNQNIDNLRHELAQRPLLSRSPARTGGQTNAPSRCRPLVVKSDTRKERNCT